MTQLTQPARVTVVRPRYGFWQGVADFVTALLTALLRGYLIMLLLPIAVPGWNLSYLRSVTVAVLAGLLFNFDHQSYRKWTKET